MPANADVIDSIFCYMHIDWSKSGLLSINKLTESSQRDLFCQDEPQRMGHWAVLNLDTTLPQLLSFYVCRPFQDVWSLC